MIGQIVGNYKIISSLGEGGVGRVYHGIDTMLDREVAIKVLRPELASQTSVVERFRSEAVTLAKLNHPNIATLYSLFRHGAELYMVLEFVRGETLEHVLQRRGALPAEEAIPIFCQALDGINYAHELGIVHRDVKPGNMMLTEKGTLKVLDFGIARLLGSSRMTRVGNIIGTLEYMSPEQVRGQESDARSDIYALGIMLYEILTGRLPFESENEFLLMKAQTEEMPAPPRAINPNIPVAVEAAVLRAMAKNPDERFQTAGEFMEVLLDAGFSLTTPFAFKSILHSRISRPSNPGLRQIENSQQSAVSSQQKKIENNNLPSKTETPAPDVLTLIAGEAVEENQNHQPSAREAIKETALGEAVVLPEQKSEVKETRFTPAAVNQVSKAAELKETRLGGIETAGANFANQNQSSSFFDRLTWVHYAGAGAVVMILCGVVTFAVIMPLLFGSPSQAVTKDPKPVVETKTPEQAVQQPTIAPTQEPTPVSQTVAKEGEPSQTQEPIVSSPPPSTANANTSAPPTTTGNANTTAPSAPKGTAKPRERDRNTGGTTAVNSNKKGNSGGKSGRNPQQEIECKLTGRCE